MTTVNQINVIGKENIVYELTPKFVKQQGYGELMYFTTGKPTLYKAGELTKVYNTISILDVISKYITEARGPAVKFLCELIKGIDSERNIVTINPKTKSDINRISRNYKVLFNDGLVIRIKPRTYIVNPFLVTPYPKHIEKVLKLWFKYQEERGPQTK